MEPQQIIVQALEKGQKALSEADSKNLLAAYGVPVVTERVASGPEEAAALAGEMGFPLVLKALGARLTHKSERGLVALNLSDERQVSQAAAKMAAEAGEDLEGFLLQPLLAGRRELVAGLFRDPQFGPVVMFGLGGIFVEALRDVSVRIHPLTDVGARAMIERLKGYPLLAGMRGKKAVDLKFIEESLLRLSQLVSDFEADLEELDLNPFIVTDRRERSYVVDARVLLRET